MKSNICKFLITGLILSVALVGCKDERNNFMVDDTVLFRNTEQHIPISIIDEEYNLVVLKSGKGFTATTVRLSVAEAALTKYNTDNGTDYVLLPSGHYNLSSSELSFTKEEMSKVVRITWNSNDIASLGTDKNFVIPLELSVDNNSIEITEGRNIVLINPLWSNVAMQTKIAPNCSPSASRKLDIYEGIVTIDNPVNKMDITINYTINNELVDAYNQENGTSFKKTPERYNISLEPSIIAAGESSTSFKLRFDVRPLFSGNELIEVDKNEYLVPVRITSTSNEAIIIREDITYIPVIMHKEVKGPWNVLEGLELSHATDPNRTWQSDYTTDNLFDGNNATSWYSWWETLNVFPMVFVADMHKVQVFTKFYVVDNNNYQGQYRNYEIYTAEEYNGANTQWNLVADGLRDYDWTGVITVYDYPVKKMIAGRYLKFVILNEQYANSGSYINKKGILNEVYGEGF